MALALVPGAALAAWPVWALTFWPAIASTLAAIPYHLQRGLEPADLPEDAAAWTRRRLDALGLIGIRVATIERSRRGPFYHPDEQVIVLPPAVHRHTARAYAAAAHELGHAIVHHQHPRLSRWLLAARRHVDGVFALAIGLWLGGALTTTPALDALGLAGCALALVLAGLVLVDEVAANHVAVAQLRTALDAAQLRRARWRLAAALATYVGHLLAIATPLVVGRWILDRVDDIDLPARIPTGAVAALATLAAVVVLAGAAAALWQLGRPNRAGGGWLRLAAIVWAPLLATALVAHPAAPDWRVALALIPAWAVLATPGWLVIGLAAAALPDDVGGAASSHPGVRRITMATLARENDEASVGARLAGVARHLWAVPLALWWLLA
ncbi:MAG: zinc metallopeptidase [Myxococcales bacterium]|nr:zinc metallopeptidase [Myxococcales bacterium]